MLMMLMYKLAGIGFNFRFSLFRATMFDASYVTGLPPQCVKTAVNHNNVSGFKKKPNHQHNSSYKEAIQALNGLLSNAATIQQSIQRQRNHIIDTRQYLERIGITPEKLDQLPIIHVSGTKGKGSTCALTESILRSFGIKTGFFSSPHLISVVERIRINGQPISRERFAEYFWKVYKSLDENKQNDDDMPAYFKFLTVLSFHVFIEEKVDVAIMEVGIGGENDCTNVVRNTKTAGITSLGLEHTNLLGNTLSDIAWQKAGIIKPNSNVFTSPQPEECMEVIKERADEKNAKLFVTPNFFDYKWTKIPNLQIDSNVQRMNASLAIQLAYDWLKTNKLQNLNGLSSKMNLNGITLDVCDEVVEGLESCFWPGRCQLVQVRNKRVFLDGAHTKESIEICCDWFRKTAMNSENEKFLIFNTTGDRDSRTLLKIISDKIHFEKAFFVTNTPFRHKTTDDINTSSYPHEQQLQRIQDNFEFWTSLYGPESACKFDNVLEVLMYLHKEIDNEKQKNVDLLVTGSLHLVGASLLALEEYERICQEKSA